MKKNELKTTKNNFKLFETNVIRTMGCSSIVLQLIEDTKEAMINSFLVENNCFNTETVKGMKEFFARNDSFIPNIVFEFIEEA